MAKHLFDELLRAPKKAYQKYGILLDYPDFRVLLGALARRDRGVPVVLVWDLAHGGKLAWLRLTAPHKRINTELSVPDMVEMAKRDPQELYSYLYVCTQLLLSRRPNA